LDPDDRCRRSAHVSKEIPDRTRAIAITATPKERSSQPRQLLTPKANPVSIASPMKTEEHTT
jgi:hypothetical protein